MNLLTDSSSYESPERDTGVFARYFPSMAFHWKMLSIYWRSNRYAVKGLLDGDRWALGSLEVLNALESVGVRFSVDNLDILKHLDGPVVFVGNHMSTLETMILPCLIQPFCDVTFITKESLLRFPVFGPVLQAREPVTVGRKDPREDLKAVLGGGKERLDSGRSIIVFPQTTRRTVFDPSQFNTIGVKLASRASVPVVPIALKTDAWGVGSLVKDFGPIDPELKVHIVFGEPVEVQGSGRDVHERVVAFIEGKLKEWELEDS